MYLLSLILSDLVQERARADLWLQTQDHCLPEHAHNGGQWGSVLRRRRICRQGLQRHGHRGIQMHCPCDQEISETSRVCIQSSVIGNLELFPFLSELNLKELMFLLCYFLEMTWQQQMPKKQQVIVLFITLAPSEILHFLLHQSYQGLIYMYRYYKSGHLSSTNVICSDPMLFQTIWRKDLVHLFSLHTFIPLYLQ